MSSAPIKRPVIGFAAHSGSGKTTLLTRLIPILNKRGIRVGVIKHAHHDFDIDKPGKDSYELRKAGADQMLVVSDKRWALMVETKPPAEPDLESMLQHFDMDQLNLILVEGFKHGDYPKIEIHRETTGHPLLFESDPGIIAIATDTTIQTDLPILPLNVPEQIADFIVTQFF